jgi:methyl-accepting chemotaxis protein
MRLRPMHSKLQPIAEAVNVTLDELTGVLKGMQMVSQAVDEHVGSVQRNSDLLVSDTRQQEEQVRKISRVMSEIATMMHSISERAALLSSTAIDTVDITSEAQGVVDRAVGGMGMVREATLQSARTMKSLSESGQEINETITEITDLSSRLHLLALNAAIEATRAGDFGQGFVLVAKEMRALATSCSEAARKVGMYVRTFQQQMNSVSHSVEQSTQHVVMQTELVTQTGVSMDAISVVTDQLSTLIKGIATTLTSQEQGSVLVVGAVEEILNVTGNITSHMQEMQQSMTHLIELTVALRARMSSFTINEQ